MSQWQIYIRHAHRDTYDRDQDNGLSPKGRKQCEKLVDYLEKHLNPKKLKEILSSPKERCFETAKYVARWAGLEVKVDLELDEQGPRETSQDFEARLDGFIAKIQGKSGICVVSHGDVLPYIGLKNRLLVDKVKKGDLFWVDEGKLKKLNPVQS